MIIPPPLNTKEREGHDISGLRVLYLLCEDVGIAQEEHVQKAFLLLRKLVGSHKFVSEFRILQDYIETQKAKKLKMRADNIKKQESEVLGVTPIFSEKV